MKVVPVAYDSMGVRSMATFVKTDRKIFIDPGVALGPRRYGLPPSTYELEALSFYHSQIIRIASRCEIIVVTHYHYDHHPFPEDSEMYRVFEGKVVLAKDRKNNINASGRKRGKIFEENVREMAKELIWADGREFEFGKTLLKISPAVWHGDVGSRVGKVIMVDVEFKGRKFVFGSDAQSLADPAAREWVLKEKPNFLIVDGYPTIFVGWRMSRRGFAEAKEGLRNVLEKVRPEVVIFDHHGVRDIKFREKMDNFWGLDVKTAAEFLGLENLFLEAWRKEIYEGREVRLNEYFEKWKEAVKEAGVEV